MYGIALASMVPGHSQVILAAGRELDVKAVELPEPVAVVHGVEIAVPASR